MPQDLGLLSRYGSEILETNIRHAFVHAQCRPQLAADLQEATAEEPELEMILDWIPLVRTELQQED